MQIENVILLEIPSYEDNRGILSSIEQNTDIPFDIKRIFYMHHIKEDRGGHAHIDTDQLIISIFGSFTAKVSFKSDSKIFMLDNPKQGLYVPRLTFIEMYDFSKNAVCLVLANTKYNINKSLRTKEAYLSFMRESDNL